MKILFFLHSFEIGGAERRCATIANHFVKRGDDVIAVLLDSPRILFPIDPRVKIIYLPYGNSSGIELSSVEKPSFSSSDTDRAEKQNSFLNEELLKNRSNQYTNEDLYKLICFYSERIRTFLKNFPDYLVVSWVSLYSISCAIALTSLPNRFIFVECNAPDAEFPRDHLFNQLKRQYYPRATAAIFQTENESGFYDYLTIKKHVIPNPVATLNIDRYVGIRKKAVVSFCRIKKAKRLPLLIEAFALFYKEFPDYKLHIFGDGPEREVLTSYIKKRDLNEAVLLFDFDTAVHKKVFDCAMFVSSSIYEGMSNSMIEAMAIGLPTICTDCYGGGARSIIHDGENGLLVPVEDPMALAEAMKKIASSTTLSERLSENAIKVNKLLSKEKILSAWEKVFDNL